MSTYEKRLSRIQHAVNLQESDRIPWAPYCQGFLANHAGYTMKDIVYDMGKAKTAFIKFVNDYQPDMLLQILNNNPGMGPIWEKLKMKNLAWAGAPDGRVGDNSIHQFLEYPLLAEEEMEEFCRDFSHFQIAKSFPRVAGLFDPMENWKFNRINPTFNAIVNVVTTLSTPESRQMIQDCWELNDMIAERVKKLRDIEQTIEDMGFPVLDKGGAAGGGFIFSTDRGIDDGKTELIEADYDTVMNYGKH